GTRRTTGPWPHVHVVTRESPTWTIVRRAVASAVLSRAGARWRRGVRNSRSARRAASDGASALSVWIAGRASRIGSGGAAGRTDVLFCIATKSRSFIGEPSVLAARGAGCGGGARGARPVEERFEGRVGSGARPRIAQQA